MTRLLLDKGLAPRAALILRQAGFDAVHVSEIGLEKADDTLILDTARSDERVCVTLDHDFHSHLAAAGHGQPSVILLRIQGIEALGQADFIRSICIQYANQLRNGAAVSASQRSIRIRLLPIR